MPDYQKAAARRTDGAKKPAPKEQKPNMGSIQQLIDVTQQSPDQQMPAPQGPSKVSMPGQLGRNMEDQQQGYSGPGAMELQEALGKLQSGVDEPGPPEAVMRRMKKQQMMMSLRPEIADLAARYGVMPRG